MQILVQTRTANIQLHDYCISVTLKKKKKRPRLGAGERKGRGSPALKSRCGAIGPWVFQKKVCTDTLHWHLALAFCCCFFCNTGHWLQGHMQARKKTYHWSISQFSFYFTFHRFSLSCPRLALNSFCSSSWPWPYNLLALASGTAGITGDYYQAWLGLE